VSRGVHSLFALPHVSTEKPIQFTFGKPELALDSDVFDSEGHTIFSEPSAVESGTQVFSRALQIKNFFLHTRTKREGVFCGTFCDQLQPGSTDVTVIFPMTTEKNQLLIVVDQLLRLRETNYDNQP
jgi:hypothetical protein